MKVRKNLDLLITILWLIAAICFLVCAIFGFAVGSYYIAVMYMALFSVDGLNAILSFRQWYRVRKMMKDINN